MGGWSLLAPISLLLTVSPPFRTDSQHYLTTIFVGLELANLPTNTSRSTCTGDKLREGTRIWTLDAAGSLRKKPRRLSCPPCHTIYLSRTRFRAGRTCRREGKRRPQGCNNLAIGNNRDSQTASEQRTVCEDSQHGHRLARISSNFFQLKLNMDPWRNK
eukprot:55775-Hanusia_phi.AAC.1